ncbi:MAG TPA: ABC-type transport auxiliary lipoprotein family protein [Steroidobacteraceae bacterium]
MKVVLGRARGGALLCALLSGGCSGLFHSTAQPEQTYYLRAPSAPAGSATPAAGSATPGSPPAVAASLRVGPARADPGLNSSHIMLVQADHRMNFYAGSRWPGPVAEVLEALEVETLRASGAWTSVEDSTSPFPSDYLLQVTVRHFEADYSSGGTVPEVHVTLDCTIGRRQGREVVATFVASGTALATANRLSDVVSAFEQATGAALGALSQQAAQAVRVAAERADQNADRPTPSITRQSQ